MAGVVRRARVDATGSSTFTRAIPRLAALVLVVAALLVVAGLALTLTREDDPLDRAELEAELERESGLGSVEGVRCVLVDTGVAGLAEFRDYDCTVTFASGARSDLGVRSVGDEWSITRR